MKLIDVDALKAVYGMGDDCKDCKRDSRSCRYNTIYTMMDFCGLIDEAPIVDAVPVVHGWWSDIGGIIRWGCSVCHYAQETKSNYCPHCGARMDGKDGEQQ